MPYSAGATSGLDKAASATSQLKSPAHQAVAQNAAAKLSSSTCTLASPQHDAHKSDPLAYTSPEHGDNPAATQQTEQPQLHLSGCMLADGSNAKQSPAPAHLKAMYGSQKKPEICCRDSDAAENVANASQAAHQPEQPPPAFSGFMLANGSRTKQPSAFAQEHARKVLQDQQLSCHPSSETAGSTAMTPIQAEDEQQQQLVLHATDLANSPLQHSAHSDTTLVPQEVQKNKTICSTASEAVLVAADSAQPVNQPVCTMSVQDPGNVLAQPPACPAARQMTCEGQQLMHANRKATQAADAACDVGHDGEPPLQ